MAYPSSLDSFTHKVNNFDTFMAEDVNELQDAIEAIEAELGTTPKGSSADVAARFAALDTLLGSNPQSIYADLAARLAGYDSGWINLPTCTYVSATSFTLTGDWTGKLKLGVYWSGYNGSQKYAYVLSSSYNSGTGKTTVNLVPNTSYSLAAGAITAAKFSYSPPPDFPNRLGYTSTLVGWSTISTTTIYYALIGHLCTISFDSVDGTSNSIATSFSVPFNAHLSQSVLGMVGVRDAGVIQTSPGHLYSTAGSNVISVYKSFLGTAWTNSGNKSIWPSVFSFIVA